MCGLVLLDVNFVFSECFLNVKCCLIRLFAQAERFYSGFLSKLKDRNVV
jgi:hypothetical protein